HRRSNDATTLRVRVARDDRLPGGGGAETAAMPVGGDRRPLADPGRTEGPDARSAGGAPEFAYHWSANLCRGSYPLSEQEDNDAQTIDARLALDGPGRMPGGVR